MNPSIRTQKSSPYVEYISSLFGSLRQKPLMAIGVIIFLIIALSAIFAPAIAPFDPFKIDLTKPLLSPNAEHWFGTDELGRDILSRIIYGARLSMLEGIFAVGIAMLIGIPYGVIAGYYGGTLDSVLMRIVDVCLAFPGVLLAIVIVSILGPSLVNAIIAIGLYTIPVFARVARGATMAARNELYIEACHSVGMSVPRIMFLHILPNIYNTLLVIGALQVALAILSASSLSFLGLGAQAPSPEWGAMLANGRNYMLMAPHVVVFPGCSIVLLVLSINLIYDGIRQEVKMPQQGQK